MTESNVVDAGALRVLDPQPPMAVTQPQAATPAFLLQMAVQQGADLDRLERLMELQERWEANEARKAYVAAMAAFKSEPILIVKDKQVYFKSKSGGAETNYFHATLANVVATVVPRLGEHDLAHRWDVTRDGPRIKVRCIVTHKLGHAESLEMDGALDDSGNKNSIQQMGSTVTYLQRYSLLSILGLATADQVDDDGAGAPLSNDAAEHADPAESYTGELAALLRDRSKMLRATKSDADALDFWKKAREQFSSIKPAYEAFKKVCEQHRVELKGGAQ